MPNWCNNTLELKHADPAMIQRAKSAFENGGFLNEFIPIPKELQITATSGNGMDEELKQKYQSNIEKYGYDNWYHFCIGEWGTKWDVNRDSGSAILEEDTLILSFDTAWSPPIEAYKKLENMGFEIWALYYESGMMFCGSYGQGSDEFYDIDAGSEWVRENIPRYLDEEFCISESMAEWEDDNEEEEEEHGQA